MPKVIIHNGSTNTPANAYLTVSGDVVGHGTYTVSANTTLSFLYGVGAGEEIMLSNEHPGDIYRAATVVINQPSRFHGSLDLTYKTPPPGPPSPGQPVPQQSHIDLYTASMNAIVDSYSYAKDMLRLWQGNRVVDTLKLNVHDPYGFTVQTMKGWVAISANTATTHGINFAQFFHPAGLPVHGALNDVSRQSR